MKPLSLPLAVCAARRTVRSPPLFLAFCSCSLGQPGGSPPGALWLLGTRNSPSRAKSRCWRRPCAVWSCSPGGQQGGSPALWVLQAGAGSLPACPSSTCPSLPPSLRLCNIPRAITAVLTWSRDIGKVFSHFKLFCWWLPSLKVVPVSSSPSRSALCRSSHRPSIFGYQGRGGAQPPTEEPHSHQRALPFLSSSLSAYYSDSKASLPLLSVTVMLGAAGFESKSKGKEDAAL